MSIADRCQMLAVGAEDDFRDVRIVSLHSRQFRSSCHVNDLNRLRTEVPRSETPSISAEDNASRFSQRHCLLPSWHAAKLNRLVKACRGQAISVRTECN